MHFLFQNIEGSQCQEKDSQVTNDKEIMIDDCKQMQEMVIQFCKELFSELSISNHHWFGNTLNGTQFDFLTQLFTRREIEEALFSLESDSSLGPNGYAVEFYKVKLLLLGRRVYGSYRVIFSISTLCTKSCIRSQLTG